MKAPLPRHIFRVLSLVAAAALTLSLASCSVLDPGPAPTMYQLSPAMPAPLSGAAQNRQLIVALPAGARDVDTDGITLIFNDREVRRLAGSRWVSDVPRMVQRNLVDALDASGAFKGVADESAGLHSNAKLFSEVRRFALVYKDANSPPTAEFVISIRLMDLSRGAVVAAKTFHTSATAGDSNESSLVKASEETLTKALPEITAWVASSTKSVK